jgi:hypothetical protein
MSFQTKVGQDTLAVFYPPSGDYPSYSGTAQWMGLVQECTFDENMNRTPNRYQGGNGGDRNLDIFLEGKTEYTGTIRYYPQDGKLWTFAVGSMAVTNGSIVTISETGGRIYWGGMELYQGKMNAATGLLRKLYGVTFDRLKISSKEGEPVECELDYACGSVLSTKAAAKPTVTEYTEKGPYMWSMVEFKISGAAWNDNIRSVKDFAFELNNNLDHPFYLNNTKFKGESIPAEREYSLDVTTNMVETSGDSLYVDYYMSGGYFNADLYCWRVSGTANAEYFQIAMSGAKITTMDMTYPIEGVVEQSFTVVPEACTFKVVESGPTYATLYPSWALAK